MAKEKEQNKSDVKKTKNLSKSINLLTVKELKAELENRNITFKKNEKKNYFVELLEQDNKQKNIKKDKTTIKSKLIKKEKKSPTAKSSVEETKKPSKSVNLLTIKELKTELKSRKITFKENEKKSYLIGLLEQNNKHKSITKEKTTIKSKSIEKQKSKKTINKSQKKSSSKSKISISKNDDIKKEKKLNTKTNFIKSDKLASLKTFYSENSDKRSKITIIMRDSHWLFAYWELGGSLFEQCKKEILRNNKSITNTTLRVINENGNYYDIDVNYSSSSFYFEPKISGQLKVELGLKNSAGRFYSIAISNTIKISDNNLKNELDDYKTADKILWMNSDKSTFETNDNMTNEMIIESLGGTKYIRKIIGSEEFLHALKENLSSAVTSNFISTIVSSFVSSGMSSENSSYNSSTITKNSKLNNENSDENDTFWLIADTELILYGATEPDATLTVAGKNISLNSDGTFFLRMPLPDGDVDLPVEAYSANGKHHRKIHPQVKKWTK